MVQGDFREVWEKLAGDEGLAAEGVLEGLEPGSRYRIGTSLGDLLEGEIAMITLPKTL
jgi:hypothetical protein